MRGWDSETTVSWIQREFVLNDVYYKCILRFLQNIRFPMWQEIYTPMSHKLLSMRSILYWILRSTDYKYTKNLGEFWQVLRAIKEIEEK